MAAMVDVKCKGCGIIFQARVADVKRGWGKFHNKSCKATVQEQRTGQHAAHKARKERDPYDEVHLSEHDSNIEIAHGDEYEWNDWDYK